jgi:hypothetical protein
MNAPGFAVDEAVSLSPNWIGPDHLILGLLREGNRAGDTLGRGEARSRSTRSTTTENTPPGQGGGRSARPGAPAQAGGLRAALR